MGVWTGFFPLSWLSAPTPLLACPTILFCLGESCPPALLPEPENPLPPHMSLALFRLLPKHWSISPRVGLLRGCLRLQQSLAHAATIPRSYGDFSPQHWTPGLRILARAGVPCSSVGTSTVESALLLLNWSTSPPLCVSFCMSSVVLFNWSSGSSQGRWLRSVFGILM